MPAAQFNRLCARCCTQHLTHTLTFLPLAPTPHRHVFEKELERAHSSSVHSVSSELAGQKLHLQFLCAIPLFTFTHDSCVMSTICQALMNKHSKVLPPKFRQKGRCALVCRQTIQDLHMAVKRGTLSREGVAILPQ